MSKEKEPTTNNIYMNKSCVLSNVKQRFSYLFYLLYFVLFYFFFYFIYKFFL
jgi:hypothetical protein